MQQFLFLCELPIHELDVKPGKSVNIYTMVQQSLDGCTFSLYPNIFFCLFYHKTRHIFDEIVS